LNGVLTASHSLALPLFRAAFSERAPTGKIVGVLAHEIDVRMMVQQSAFTIHDTATPLEELPGAADFLIKFEVAASAKRRCGVSCGKSASASQLSFRISEASRESLSTRCETAAVAADHFAADFAGGFLLMMFDVASEEQ